jgi:NAD(P)-dependent dehydrogenase (short-subunit alcohol dehydrogenase family)
MIDQGRGGAIVITSSTAGLSGMHDGSRGIAAYCASKHGVVGLMRGYAKILGEAILWLVSDEARAVTGVTLPVDCGVTCP